MPNEVLNMISDLYGNFTTRIAWKDYITNPIKVERGVLQGDCLSPLLFNLVFNSFIQTIKSDEFKQLSYRYTKALAAIRRRCYCYFRFRKRQPNFAKCIHGDGVIGHR